MENITYVITGRGARIKHIHHEGRVMCPSPAASPAVNRFERLPVCKRCVAAYDEAVALAAEKQAAEQDANLVEVHFSARVAAFMSRRLSTVRSKLAADLAAPRLERRGFGFTAFTTTTRERAEVLLMELEDLQAEMEVGDHPMGPKAGMNFQLEAVIKAIRHVSTDLREAA